MAHLLVIDDEPETRYAISQVLASAGHTVDEAADGWNADRMMAARAYDGIICDLLLPNGIGLHLIRAARRLMPRVAVICVTGDGLAASADHAARAKALDATAILRKPFDFDTLLDVVEQSLNPTDEPAHPAISGRSRHA